MKNYKVQITEYLTKIINIEAETEEEAYDKAKELYNNEEVILDYNDITQTEIEIIRE